ncbi:MAG: hypothetical protein WC650_06160 [Candidatus Doudnabacteria bacterium]
MDKRIASIIIFISLFCSVGFVSAVLENPLGVDTFGALLLKIADGVGTLIATLGTVMIIVAGILYLTSAGSPERMGTAKKALAYAVIGIVIGLAATAIVNIIEGIIGIQ